MYLITNANFTRELSVPNLSGSQSGNAEQLNLYGDEKPRLLLQMCLGSVLFTDFNSNVTNGVLDTDAPQKWKNLVNGCTYNTDKVWRGLKYTEGSFNISLLAYYTYWHWFNDNITISGVGGELQLSTKNANNVSPTPKLVDVWNKFLEMYQGLGCDNVGLNRKMYDINGVLFVDYFNGGQNSNYVSLLQFLQDNPIDYPNPQLYTFEYGSNSNSLGL